MKMSNRQMPCQTQSLQLVHVDHGQKAANRVGGNGGE